MGCILGPEAGVTLGAGKGAICGAGTGLTDDVNMATTTGFVELAMGTVKVVLRLVPIDHFEKIFPP